jgi:chromatin assembly factor 1 subunit A
VKEIVMTMQDPSLNTIDLTGDETTKHGKNPMEMLKKIPVKILKFREDVRPPYQGTFTKRLSEHFALKLCRNPFARTIPDLNYDYDSEAEWEEPEEGEELNSEGEEDGSEDGDEDMDGFLDDRDEDPANGKRRIIVGDLEPVCSGIRWDEDNQTDPIFKSYQMEIISGRIAVFFF